MWRCGVVMDYDWRMSGSYAATPSRRHSHSSRTIGRLQPGLSCEPCSETCTCSTVYAGNYWYPACRWPRMRGIRGSTGAPSDGDVASGTPHAFVSVLVRTRPCRKCSGKGGSAWASRSYTFKGRTICVLSGPRTDAAVQSLTDPANDLLHARLPCHEPAHWALQLQECHEDHLHLPHRGVGPTQLDHIWFTGLRDVCRPHMPGPLTHRLIHPVRRKKASTRT